MSAGQLLTVPEWHRIASCVVRRAWKLVNEGELKLPVTVEVSDESGVLVCFRIPDLTGDIETVGPALPPRDYYFPIGVRIWDSVLSFEFEYAPGRRVIQ